MNEWIQQGITAFNDMSKLKNNGLLTLGLRDRRDEQYLQIYQVMMVRHWLKGRRITKYKQSSIRWPRTPPLFASHINMRSLVRVMGITRWPVMFSALVIDLRILILMIDAVYRQCFICPFKHSLNKRGAHL
jgi:hypothetical protein